jgi:hypothetical protein
MISLNGTTYFTEQELQCKLTKKVVLAKGFEQALVELRVKWGKPMVVNSCCRSKQHNFNEGGNPTSLHVYDFPHWPTGGTCAIDIAMTDAIRRAALTSLALANGWWVGVNKTFLHLDRRVDFGVADQVGIFLYS